MKPAVSVRERFRRFSCQSAHPSLVFVAPASTTTGQSFLAKVRGHMGCSSFLAILVKFGKLFRIYQEIMESAKHAILSIFGVLKWQLASCQLGSPGPVLDRYRGTRLQLWHEAILGPHWLSDGNMFTFMGTKRFGGPSCICLSGFLSSVQRDP